VVWEVWPAGHDVVLDMHVAVSLADAAHHWQPAMLTQPAHAVSAEQLACVEANDATTSCGVAEEHVDRALERDQHPKKEKTHVH